MATQDSLLSASNPQGKYKIPKNLLWIIMGLLIAAVLAVLVFTNGFKNESRVPQKIEPTIQSTEAPAPETIEGIARAQEEEARKEQEEEERRKREALPPLGSFPEIDKTKAPVQGQNAVADTGTEARENLIRSSPILAINESSLMGFGEKFGGAGEVDNEVAQMRKRNQEESKAAAQSKIEAMMNQAKNLTGGAQQGPITNAKMESDWLQETGKLRKGHEPARGYTPTSRNILFQGTVFNMVAMKAINTDLPGEFRAQVTMDVYDSIRGSTLLIPKGTIFNGRYNGNVRVGQDRVNAAFTRIILPNGISVDIDGSLAQMPDGSTGIKGDVDNHYGQMLYISALNALGAVWVTRNDKTADQSGGINGGGISSPAGQILTDVNRAVLERNKWMSPTIATEAGERFTISLDKDVELPPYVRR